MLRFMNLEKIISRRASPSGGSRGGSLSSIEPPPFQTEVSGRLKQLVSKFLLR